MKKITILCTLLLGFYQGGTCNNNGTFTLDNSTEVVESTTPAVSLDDFIVLNLVEFGTMYTKKLLIYKGMIQGRLWYEDRNGTKYTIAVLKSPEEREKELEDKLKNHTGDGLICVDHVCLPPDRAKIYLDDSRAEREERLLTYQVVPFAIMVSVFIIVAFCGVTGNVLIIVGILQSGSLRNSTTVFLCSLAASDIIVLIVCLPMQVMGMYFSSYTTLSIPLCKFMYMVRYFSIISSVSIMSSMAVERYIAICHPLMAKSICTVRNALIAVIIIWIISIAICIPVTFITGSNNGCRLNADKFWHLVLLYAVLFVAIFVIPLGFMAPLYTKIFYVLWKSGKESRKLQSSQDNEQKKGQQDNNTIRSRKKVIKMLVILLVLFIVCWGPPVMLDLVYTARLLPLDSEGILAWKRTASIGLVSIGICNSALNPIVYICMSKQFRLKVKSLLSRCCGLKTNTDGQHSGTESAVSGKTLSSAI